MKILRSDCIIVQGVLEKLLNKPMRPQLAQFVAVAYSEVAKVVLYIQDNFVPVEGWKEYQEKRDNILKAAGGVKQPNGQWSLPGSEKTAKAQESLKLLDEESEDLIEEQGLYAREYQEIIETVESDLDIEPFDIALFDFNIEPGILVELMRCGILKRSVEDGSKQGDIRK